MKTLTLLLASTFLFACAGDSHAVVRIAKDRGGLIQRYLDRYDELNGTGQTVVIDGLCASACTIVLAATALSPRPALPCPPAAPAALASALRACTKRPP